MDKNFDLYCAASLLVEASKFLRDHDREFGEKILSKVTEYMGQIKVDEELIEEVKSYGKQLQEKIEGQNQSAKGAGKNKQPKFFDRSNPNRGL